MKVVFRVDSSHQIGTGHLMRCLTLADALFLAGVQCSFITREHSGNLTALIKSKGYKTHLLPTPKHLPSKSLVSTTDDNSFACKLSYSDWLGVSLNHDALECLDILNCDRPDWLVVDHYALDCQWQNALRGSSNKLMVIDDLANRKHECNLLLDQTLNRKPEEYSTLIPKSCLTLCGSQYSLLRPDFTKFREYSLDRRKSGSLRSILLNLGGVDKDNISGLVLEWLSGFSLPPDIKINVVLGPKAPWIDEIRNQIKTLALDTKLIVGTNQMAELMAESDLAIRAAGTTAWERCCMGLPTIVFILASNQLLVSQQLLRKGAAIIISLKDNPKESLQNAIESLICDSNRLLEMSKKSAEVTDGTGVQSVLDAMGV